MLVSNLDTPYNFTIWQQDVCTIDEQRIRADTITYNLGDLS